VAGHKSLARTLCDVRVADDDPERVEIVLAAPATTELKIQDDCGRPVAGAQVREVRRRGANGSLLILQPWFEHFGLSFPASDGEGRMRLPELPAGDLVDLTIEHADLAPMRITDLRIGSPTPAEATMRPGVALVLRIPANALCERGSMPTLKLHHASRDAATIRGREMPFDKAGRARIVVEPGDYWYLRMEHAEYFITPDHVNITPDHTTRLAKGDCLTIDVGSNDDLRFEVRRKVQARGRVIDADSGRPVRGIPVYGEIPNVAPAGAPLPRDAWTAGGWAGTDENGEYAVSLTAGPARVFVDGDGYITDAERLDVVVAADGSTLFPDLLVRVQPKVVGVVIDADGRPVCGAVVRIRGRLATPPVRTDAKGRFEIQPQWIPRDPLTHARLAVQPLVAFDPHRRLACRAEVRLDRPRSTVLRLEPHDGDWVLTEFESELSDRERGPFAAGESPDDAARSLCGEPAPELDGALWLNTGQRPLELADLRGKYVLLDFWFSRCGPCHAAFPTVKLLHELYKDQGLVVIGVHDNSASPEAVRAHVAKIGLPFPVIVDHPDGRTVARYQAHGIAHGFPSYVLIGPDGNVLLDDRTIPHPTLRSHLVEIVRKHLFAWESTSL
jgi:thiol-disulfide isomerase/thioredoxin